MIQKSLPRQAPWLPVGLLLLAVMVLAPGASATTDSGWQIRFYAAAIDMEHDSAPDRPDGFGFDMDAGAGAGFNAEYRFSRRLGVDLGVLSGAGVDVAHYRTFAGNSGWVTSETLTFTPFTVGLDIHLTPDARVDVYACPLVALVQYGGLAVRSGPTGVSTDWDFDEDLAVGATLGLGVPIGQRRWSFQANLTYLDSSLEGRGSNGSRFDGGYDSTVFGLGFGYRFGGKPG